MVFPVNPQTLSVIITEREVEKPWTLSQQYRVKFSMSLRIEKYGC